MQVCKYENIKYVRVQICKYAHICKYASIQVCKYASMQVCKCALICKYASIQVYTGVYKKLNKKKENHRWSVRKIWNANKCEAMYMSEVAAFF